MAVLPLFPAPPAAFPGYSVHKRPTFASIVQSPPSGREVTDRQMNFPLWEFELTYEVLRDQSQNSAIFESVKGFTELQAISAFYVERNGQFGAFLYQDPDDYSRAGQELGIGDGLTDSFLFYRTFGTALYNIIEPVGIVDVRTGVTLNVYLNGVFQTQAGNWWIDPQDLRTLKFVTPPSAGVGVTVDFSFFYYCRFIDDSAELEEFMNGRWKIGGLKFRSTKPDPANTLNNPTIVGQNTTITTAQSSILAYFEATMTQVLSTAYGFIGIANSSALVAPAFNFLANATSTELANMAIIEFQPGGSFIGYGYPIRPGALSGPNVQGDAIGIAINRTTKKIWWRNSTQNPGSWMGSQSGTGAPDPVTGNRGFTFGPSGEAPIGGNIYIFAGGGWMVFGGTLHAIVSINVGDSAFVAAPPTGYSRWGGASVLSSSDKGPEIVISSSNTLTTVDMFCPNNSYEAGEFVRSVSNRPPL